MFSVIKKIERKFDGTILWVNYSSKPMKFEDKIFRWTLKWDQPQYSMKTRCLDFSTKTRAYLYHIILYLVVGITYSIPVQLDLDSQVNQMNVKDSIGMRLGNVLTKKMYQNTISQNTAVLRRFTLWWYAMVCYWIMTPGALLGRAVRIIAHQQSGEVFWAQVNLAIWIRIVSFILHWPSSW